MVETITFLVSAAIVLGGAFGVILSRNPVHAALSLVASLFGVAVLFVAQQAHLLAAVQVIIYTGAIVILILFVLMLLGVDKDEDIATEPIVGQRALAVAAGVAGFVAICAVLLVPVLQSDDDDASFESVMLTGQRSMTGEVLVEEPVDDDDGTVTEFEVGPDGFPVVPEARTREVESDTNLRQIGRSLFTDYVFAFEVTALLLTIAVVGAVVLVRRVRDPLPLPPDPEPLGAGPAGDDDRHDDDRGGED
jgi:NADH-quinone oxidoreductase subunit J